MTQEINSLTLQSHDLIRKLEHDSNYKSVQAKELDLTELSDLKKQIKKLTYARIKNQRVKLVKKLDKSVTPKEVRKIFNEKYESLRLQTNASLDFYKECVKEKKYARELKDKFDESMKKQKSGKKLSKDDRKIIEEILGW